MGNFRLGHTLGNRLFGELSIVSNYWRWLCGQFPSLEQLRRKGLGIPEGRSWSKSATLYHRSMKHVFFQKGFRPFFFFGGIVGAALVPWWYRTYDDALTGEPGLEGISWHSHEMIFGFTVAILAGFLLTAVENWTDRKTARGGLLVALVAIWAVGRLVGVGGVTATIAGFADLTFLPFLTVVIGIPLILAGSRRNYVLLAALPVLWLCDVLHHLRASGLLPQSSLRADLVAVDVIVLILVIITGRIIPIFTRNGLQDQRVQAINGLNTAALVAVALVVVVEIFAPTGPLMAVAAGIAGLLVFARAYRWGAHRTLGKPIIWILHLGHAWIGVGLLMKAAAAVWMGIPPTVATHALTAGAIGTLTLGMMARVTVGHTGRTIIASPAMVVAFVAIMVSAAFRVAGPWFWPQANRTTLMVSAVGWSLAFALYVVVNGGILMTPRPDGKEG